jgi:hypothetical protein
MVDQFKRIDPDADEDEIIDAISVAMVSPEALRKTQEHLRSEGHHAVAELLDSFAHRETFTSMAEILAALDGKKTPPC